MNRTELRTEITALKKVGVSEHQALQVLRRKAPKELIRKVYREKED